ncbi:Sorting nexin-41 [Mycena chlorophos]|uniref:Protein BFR2 n=1 Tax=Mycena chlorophos TaxID=658473 RepID=A0A8H6W7J3_MYCCL|nr:Sorting nexin-41 [Mycena chlorophos]
MAKPNGTAAPTPPPATAKTNIPAVVGINFGNSYASIAVYTKEGQAECIANENGERQIACAVSFHGEEIYVGNQAMPQLVKNAQNTITGFRNLLGKKFSEIDQSTALKSAPIIQHPTEPDTPAYEVEILQPAPTPLPLSAATTPAASHAATPRSEPIPAKRILTPQEVATMFLSSLLQSATDFLGKPILGAVINSPPSFSQIQKDALKKAAEDAGVRVLQLLDEPSAVLTATTSPHWPGGAEDRTQLIIDVGASSLSLAVVALRSGLGYIQGSRHTNNVANVGGDALTALLVKYFSKEFTKKTKVDFPNPPSSKEDIRATTKLVLALEHTKRTLSASPAPASLSVESLHSGNDYTATIARMRFDLLAAPVYNTISSEIKSLLESIPLDSHDIDEVVYVGGTACLPGLDSHLLNSVGFPETVKTCFSNLTMGSGAVGDPTGVLSVGCALQAALLLEIQNSPELLAAFDQSPAVKTSARTIGMLFPTAQEEHEMGGLFIAVLHKNTPLPARRVFELEVTLSGGESDKATKFGFELWEVEERIHVEKIAPPKPEEPLEDDEEEEEEEPEEVKTKKFEKAGCLGVLLGETKGTASKGKKGTYTANIRVEFILTEGGLSVVARDEKEEKVLAETLAQLDEAAPVDFDPEDVLARSEPLQDSVLEPVREHYVDVGPSTLRKLQSIADPKYDGVKTSRKQLMEDSDHDNDDDDEKVPSESEGSASESEEDEGPPTPADDLSTSLQKTLDADRKKGKAVAQQIATWETLLDARIGLQKAVSVSQKLPSSSQLSRYTEVKGCREALDKMLDEAFLLSDELFDLQEKLLTANESAVPPPRKRPTDAASALEHAYHQHLVQNLNKWSTKIQAVAPAALLPSNRNAFSSRNSQNLKSAVQLIDETLLDHRKLVARTQVRRGKGLRLGEGDEMEEDEDAVDVEMFDDTDFYQQLLRDVIDSRSGGVAGADNWMALQRQRKAKKKVDTKASKGRKIRYETHEKLQNFMVPVLVPGLWHEEQIDELFSSLLGRGFEGALGKDVEETAQEERMGEEVLRGFKIFG